MEANPYDELPYLSLPIEWTAPERLALASRLRGGPRPPLDSYRVLELGCGTGGNLLPLAYYRPNAQFVGVDGARSAIATAEQRRAELKLTNLELVHADFQNAADRLADRFDFIIAHGVFSWVADEIRDALFGLCAGRLRPGGLLYLNYNTRPGWDVRGLVRDFLLAQTARAGDLASRTALARELAASLAASLEAAESYPYTRLLENELRFVSQSHPSYVAHEFLAPHNHAYWRSDFLALARQYGLEYVADADFNYPSGRVQADLPAQTADARLLDRFADDAVDLVAFRQLHSPIFTLAPWARREPTAQDVSDLVVASRLEAVPSEPGGHPTFRDPTGVTVEAKEDVVRVALETLRPLWPRGLPVAALFPGDRAPLDDLRLLHLHGLIELRIAEPSSGSRSPDPLNERERAWGGYATTPYHTRN